MTSTYKERLATYKKWPHVSPTPEDLAAAGFCHEPGTKDLTTCSECGLELSNWKPKRRSITAHGRQSSNCSFFQRVVERELASSEDDEAEEAVAATKETAELEVDVAASSESKAKVKASKSKKFKISLSSVSVEPCPEPDIQSDDDMTPEMWALWKTVGKDDEAEEATAITKKAVETEATIAAKPKPKPRPKTKPRNSSESFKFEEFTVSLSRPTPVKSRSEPIIRLDEILKLNPAIAVAMTSLCLDEPDADEAANSPH